MSVFAKFKNLIDFDGVVFRALGLDETNSDRIAKLSGVKKPTKAEAAWRIPALPLHVEYLSNLPIIWTTKASEQGRYLITEAAERIQLSKATDADIDFEGFGKMPYPYQKAGVAYLLRAKRVMLADDMGLGKTLQLLGLMHKAGADCFPALIITLSSLKYWWKEEGEACLPGRRFTVFEGGANFKPLDIALSDVCVVNYDILANGWETPDKKNVKLTPLGQALLEHSFRLIAGDELQAIKNYGAQRTKACIKLAEGKPYRVGITGTPVSNNLKELVPQLQFLGRLADVGGYMYFMKTYCAQKNKFNPFGGSRNGVKLNERMRASFYLRRTKADVQLELPPLTRTIIPVEIDNRPEYKLAEDRLIEWVKERAEQDKKFLETIKDLSEDLQRLAIEEHKNDKAERAKRAEAMIRIGALKDVAARGKLKSALQWIDNFLESGEKLIVFATHAHILDALKARYPDAASITSDMPSIKRQEANNRFQKDPDCQMMIGAFGTHSGSAPAATGLTMTSASNILTLELSWTSTHHDQGESRAHRNGQTKPVTSHYLIGKDTIEKRILALLDAKREICIQVTDGAENVSTPPLVDLLMDELAKG